MLRLSEIHRLRKALERFSNAIEGAYPDLAETIGQREDPASETIRNALTALGQSHGWIGVRQRLRRDTFDPPLQPKDTPNA